MAPEPVKVPEKKTQTLVYSKTDRGDLVQLCNINSGVCSLVPIEHVPDHATEECSLEEVVVTDHATGEKEVEKVIACEIPVEEEHPEVVHPEVVHKEVVAPIVHEPEHIPVVAPIVHESEHVPVAVQEAPK